MLQKEEWKKGKIEKSNADGMTALLLVYKYGS